MSGRKEFLDPTPVEMPLNFRRPLTLQEEIKRLVRAEVSRAAEAEGMETFEEADDFEVDEDPDPLSAYEVTEMQQEAAYKEESLDGKAVSPAAPEVPGSVPGSAPVGEAPPVAKPA